MRHSRVYTSQTLASGDTVSLDKSASHYLADVLRVLEGDIVTLFNGNGSDYQGVVCEMQRHRVKVRLTRSRVPDNESRLKITLIQAITRSQRMDYALQKATELGVSSIQPLMSSRVEVRLDEKRQANRLAHWRTVVTSACEQSGRAVVPEILTPCSLQTWLAGATKVGSESASGRLVLVPRAGLKLSDYALSHKAVSVFVGPEGGFSKEELQSLHAAAVTGVSLGPRILRTETAGPVAIALLQAKAGDL